MNYSLEDLQQLTIEWSTDRGIITNGKVTTQGLKLVSEIGELADNIIKNKDIKDDIGDCLVVLCNIAAMKGLTLNECWTHAYLEIKDRKGILNKEGNFIKDTDLAYEQALKELKNGK